MSNCPVCGAAVTEDFGLVECAKCQAQLIVHIDGRVEVQGEDTPPLEAMPEQVYPPRQNEFQESAEADTPLAEPEPEPELEGVSVDFSNEAEPPPPPPPVEAEENVFDGTEPPPPEEAPQVYSAPGAAPAPQNLNDLAAFANSEDSGGREGPLRYTLLITGIDTADVRDAFREALTDRKFMWDTEQILRGIRQGNVRIENVPPGKAFILVNRLRNLPLQIRWEQNAITQP